MGRTSILTFFFSS